jgi:hypothetical protein
MAAELGPMDRFCAPSVGGYHFILLIPVVNSNYLWSSSPMILNACTSAG